MANLKGGTFAKQCKDAFHRLQAFGISRVGKEDNLTHSDKLAEKREMYLRDISSYFQKNDIDGKLNQLFTKENLDSFFTERFIDLASNTKENYLRGFSSMLKGLESKNIEIPVHTECEKYFDDYVAQIKDEADIQIENRYIKNAQETINSLYQHRYISGLIAQTQYELSIRQEEAFELIRNPLNYIDHGVVEGLVGKGNHCYETKVISFELEQKIITNYEELISKSTYYSDLKEHSISSHDFRFTSARDKYEVLTAKGYCQKEAKLTISKELNHKREEITNYYLQRAYK